LGLDEAAVEDIVQQVFIVVFRRLDEFEGRASPRTWLLRIFQDVNLDCAGVLTGWQPINADYEWTTVVLTRSGKPQEFPSGSCPDGAHRIQSAGPFTIAVWDADTAASRSCPGGMGLRQVPQVRVPVN
jgi:IgGFc binding protein/Sigma-70 region 2